jgi:hypothetical protein
MWNVYKIQFDQMEWIEVDDGMRFKRFQQGDLQLWLVDWEKATKVLGYIKNNRVVL